MEMKPLCAVIVENRPKQNLIQVINNHMSFLPEGTPLYIYYGKYTAYLRNLYPTAIFTEIKGEFGLREYNELLTSTNFWSQFFNYSRVMIFQSDGKMLRSGIEKFYEWDYVGAPWQFQQHGGNGGESLRNPKLMHEICSTHTWDGINEDVWICNIMHNEGSDMLAPRSVCEEWGVEAIFKLGTLTSHSPEKWLTPEQCELIKNQ